MLKKAFVIMPFKQPFDGGDGGSYFAKIYKPALEPLGYEVTKANDISVPSIVVHEVIRRIRSADMILAELTGKNANVFYELGVAQQLPKPVIMISQDEDIPFNIQHYGIIKYDTGAADWEQKLIERIRDSVRAIPHRLHPEGPEDWNVNRFGLHGISVSSDHADFKQQISAAQSIDFCFNTGQTMLQKYLFDFSAAMKRGCKIRFLINDPDQPLFCDESEQTRRIRQAYDWSGSARESMITAGRLIRRIADEADCQTAVADICRHAACLITMGMMIFDKQDYYLTPYLPYRGSNETMRFLFDRRQAGETANHQLLNDVQRSFDEAWDNALDMQ